jgi:Hypothetical glycosyl hydrolase 6
VAADFDWMHTARAFLIDAYEPPFATKLEFDAEALAKTMVSMNANTVRIAAIGKYALIPGVRFTPHPELGNRDILAEVIAASKPRVRVVPYSSTGHKLAWTMVTRHHPEYAQRTVGKRAYCFNIPKGKKVRSVVLPVDSPFRKQHNGSSLEINIPRVQAYQGVRVELEEK